MYVVFYKVIKKVTIVIFYAYFRIKHFYFQIHSLKFGYCKQRSVILLHVYENCMFFATAY